MVLLKLMRQMWAHVFTKRSVNGRFRIVHGAGEGADVTYSPSENADFSAVTMIGWIGRDIQLTTIFTSPSELPGSWMCFVLSHSFSRSGDKRAVSSSQQPVEPAVKWHL